jgi:hypothetical protein
MEGPEMESCEIETGNILAEKKKVESSNCCDSPAQGMEKPPC